MAGMLLLSNDPKMSEGNEITPRISRRILAIQCARGTATPADMHTEAPNWGAAPPHCEVHFRDWAVIRVIQHGSHRRIGCFCSIRCLARIGYGYYCDKSVCVQLTGLAKKKFGC